MKKYLLIAFVSCLMLACTPEQQQKADTVQANIDKVAPVVQDRITKATPVINEVVDFGLTLGGKGDLVPINDAATQVLEKGQAAVAAKAVADKAAAAAAAAAANSPPAAPPK